MSNPQHFNDEFDNMNDEGYDIHEEWLREEEEYWSEDTLDPADSGEYDPVSEDTDDEDMDETPIGLEYDGYNDPDNF